MTAHPAVKPTVLAMARSPAIAHVPKAPLAVKPAATTQSPTAHPATVHQIPSVANSPAASVPQATHRVPTANRAVPIPKADIA